MIFPRAITFYVKFCVVLQMAPSGIPSASPYIGHKCNLFVGYGSCQVPKVLLTTVESAIEFG